MSSFSETPHHRIPIREMMSQLAAELGFLVQATVTVEKAVDAVVTSIPLLSAQAVRDLQNLDLLVQSLAALAAYTQELVPHCPTNVQIDSGSAAHVISLTALARRLRIGGMDPFAEHHVSDLEMFR